MSTTLAMAVWVMGAAGWICCAWAVHTDRWRREAAHWRREADDWRHHAVVSDERIKLLTLRADECRRQLGMRGGDDSAAGATEFHRLM